MKLERFKINNRIHKVIYILGIIIIIFMSIFIFYKSYAVYEVIDNKNIIEGTVQEMGDLSFVFYIDGNVSMNVPEQKTNYVFNTEKSSCTNGAKIDWDKHEWQPIVTNLDSNKTKCILYFEANASAYLASIAINSSDLEYDGTTNNDLRYAGQNPSNYVDLGKDIQQMYIMAILLIIINICLKYLVH